jgi:hypothetical protein
MALVALAIAWCGFGCDTHAVGVSDCRSIEKARCAAASSCDFRIDASNEAECERFARDNCLHGLPTDHGPTAGELDRCLKSIRAASECAADKNQGPGTLALGCNKPIGEITLATATVCDIIESPEEAIACSFLLADPKPAVVVDAGVKD